MATGGMVTEGVIFNIYTLFLVPFIQSHTESETLIKQDLISVRIDLTSGSESGADSRVEESMLSSKTVMLGNTSPISFTL